MKIIYLAAYTAVHNDYDIDYQDITGERDINGCMLDIDLANYDVIIATPPCNYWTRANWRRETSIYSQETKHLLPDIIKKLANQDKPFIVENVRNYPLFEKHGLFDLGVESYIIGRHTYWSNVNLKHLESLKFEHDGINNKSSNNRQGGKQVHYVIERFLEILRDEV